MLRASLRSIASVFISTYSEILLFIKRIKTRYMEKQFFTYRQPISSYEQGESLLGILKPGRYCGFNAFTLISETSEAWLVAMSHANDSTSIRKSSKTTPPALGNYTGVIITPQGQIIQNDDVSIPISISKNPQTYERHDLIYCEHTYSSSKGSNPASYSVIEGDPNVFLYGIPALSNTAIQVTIGYIDIPPSATFNDIIFRPAYTPELGNLTLRELTSVLKDDYTSTNYITNSSNYLISNISALDTQVKSNSDNIVLLNNKKLDDLATPDDNTDLNATTARHGLLPKLPLDSYNKYLKGDGTWATPQPLWTWTNRTVVNAVDFSKSSGDIISTGGELYLDNTIIPTYNAQEVLVAISVEFGKPDCTSTGTAYGQIGFTGYNGINANYIRLMPFNSVPYQRFELQMVLDLWVDIGSVYYIPYKVETNSGAIADWFSNATHPLEILVRVLAYR